MVFIMAMAIYAERHFVMKAWNSWKYVNKLQATMHVWNKIITERWYTLVKGLEMVHIFQVTTR